MFNPIMLALVVALNAGEIPSGNNGHNYLAPKQVYDAQQNGLSLVSGSINATQIQPVLFQAKQGAVVSFVPHEVKPSNQNGNIYLTVFDGNGRIIESEYGSPYKTVVGFYAPMTGNYRIEIAGDSLNYVYKLKIE